MSGRPDIGRAIISQSVRKWLATGCMIALAAASAGPAFADYKKVGPDKRSKAQVAENECEAQSNGSRQIIVGTLLGGLIGQAIARDGYVKDCMKARGYERVSPKKKPQKKRSNGKNN